MNILVVGGAGFLGCNLVRRCLKEVDVTLTVVDSLDAHMRSSTSSLHDVWSDIRFVRGDMRDATLMADLVKRQDIIFNCAAQTSHPLSLHMPLFDAEINCLGNLTLLEAIRQNNPDAVVVYTSSSTVVGPSPGQIIDETHAEQPLDIYSANKGVAEKYYRIYHAVHNLKTIVLRLPNLYGPYGKGFPEFGFVNYFINRAWTNQEITIYGMGEQTRNLLFVEDAVELLMCGALQPELIGKILFAAHEDEHLSVAEIAQLIVKVFERGNVTHIDWPALRRRIEVEHVRISAARLRELTTWSPRYSFEAGLRKTRAIMERAGYPS